MLRRRPCLLLGRGLLCACLLGVAAGVAEARGSGIDFWLLDENGKQIRKLEGPGVTLRIPISPSDDAVPGVRVVGAGANALLEVSYKPQGRDAPRAARQVRAVDPSTARTLWTADPASVGSASDAHIVLVSPRRSVGFHPWADEDPDTPSVYAAAPATGAPLWRWRVPGPPGGYCDDAHIAVHSCPSGYLVTRDWGVLD